MSDFEPIAGTSPYWGLADDVKALSEDDTEAIAELLMGRTVEKVDGEHLLLDDGTVIKAIGHEGGCSCGAGDYDLTVLNRVDNVITKVEFDYHPADDYERPARTGHPDDPEDEHQGWYRIFVFAGDERISLMQVDGSDGNGYYGTGFGLLVRPVKAGAR